MSFRSLGYDRIEVLSERIKGVVLVYIRKAKKEDAYDLAVVHIASWRTTYKNIIDESYLEAMSLEDKIEQWQMILRDGNVFVVENNNQQIIGFGGVGPERTGAFTGYDAEVYSIYFLHPYQGKGLGKQLLRTMTEFLIEDGYQSMLIWVLADNQAVGFYEAMGGKKVGQERIDIGNQSLMEYAYGWKDLNALI